MSYYTDQIRALVLQAIEASHGSPAGAVLMLAEAIGTIDANATDSELDQSPSVRKVVDAMRAVVAAKGPSGAVS